MLKSLDGLPVISADGAMDVKQTAQRSHDVEAATDEALQAVQQAPVAQLDRASPSEGGGDTFESCRARHFSFILQSDMRVRTEIPVLSHSNE